MNGQDGAAPDQGDLKQYTRLKLSIANQLRLLRDIVKRRGNETGDRQCGELMAKLAEDRFTLAVVGQFKRGKSSLMNAIIGRELLPTGVLPLTSAITVVKFGPQERLVVEREGWSWPQIVPLAQLEDYATERGNPGNRKRVKTVVVEVPVQFLRRGLEFVDTPGIGSVIAANTATTYAFLPQCDAVLFVTSVDSPFTSTEMEFLREIRRHIHKVFFVVNKTDLVSEHECREVLEFAVQTLRKQMGTETIRIFPLSCKLSLAAKIDGDALHYVASGLKMLEEELGQFLSDEKGRTFLVTVVDRALGFIDAEVKDVSLSKRARELPQPARQRRIDAIRCKWRQQAALRRDVFEEIHTHVLVTVREVLSPAIDSFLKVEHSDFLLRLHRLLHIVRWCPCNSATKWIIDWESRWHHSRTRRWLSSHAEKLVFNSDGFCCELWDRVRANLGEIPEWASTALGLGHSDHPITECLLPWRLEAELIPPPNDDARWSVRLPWWLKPLPVGAVESWLAKRLEKEYAQHLESYKYLLLAVAENQFRAALEVAWNEISKRAAEIELRVQAMIQGGPAEESGEAILDSIRETLLTIRKEVLALSVDSEVPPIIIEPASSVIPSVPAQPEEINLKQDLGTRGCPVCDHLYHVSFGFFAHWQYDLSLNEKAQMQFAEECGFCSLHAWQLEAVSSMVGSSVGYTRLVERFARILTQAAQSTDAERIVRELVPASQTCRLCRLLRDREHDYIERLAMFLNDSQNRDTYSRGQGVCLRHLAALIAAPKHGGIVSFLLTHSAHRFEEVAEDMQAYAMKNDALRRALHNEDERDAYWRAITHIVGAKSVSLPWQEEVEMEG